MSGRANQLVEAGLWLQLGGDLEGAHRLFKEALKAEPGHARAKALLAGAPGEALPSELEQVASHPPEDPFALPRGERVEPPSDWTGWESQFGAAVEVAPAEASDDEDPFSLIASPVEPPPPPPRPRLAAPKEELLTLLQGVDDLLALDDFSGAIDLLRKAQALAPDDPEVEQRRIWSEAALETMLESKLGTGGGVPQVVLGNDEIIWLNLDHRAGFVLAQIDGSVTFDDVFALSGMSRLDTARILVQLREEGVITVG